MANKVQTIRIDSILGGTSPTTHYGSSNQFRASLGIDPAQPIDDADSATSSIAAGLLRPAACSAISTTVVTSAPLWIKANPKTAFAYVLDANGSAYTINASFDTITAISDAGELSNGTGNGCEYYDNYMYFAKDTTIARLGPLSGTTTLNGNYWVGTLALTALEDTTYPTSYKNGIQYPNHVMKRHSDGKLYIADVVGNTGTLHFIQTSKTTVEGDTNNGSDYDKVNVGYGLWPTAMESYGEELVIAFYEGSNASLKQPRAKVAFWDTTSTNVNKMIWVEFPDQIITALKNVNGVLFAVSGNINTKGFRVTRFLGGYTFEEVWYSETGEPCMPDAVDGILNQFLIGNYTTVPESAGCVYSYGLQKGALGQGFFNTMRASGSGSSTTVTATLIADNNELAFFGPIIGWTQAGDGSTGVQHGFDRQATTYSNAPSMWWSSVYRIGARFKITRVRIPLSQAVASGMTIIPKIYIDDAIASSTLTTIDYTNYPGVRFVTIRPDGLVGQNNFWLELKWAGDSLLTVGLPIEIDFEIVPE